MTELNAAALLFAGQGNPTIGMGADIWDVNESTRRIWDCASDISGSNIRRLCLKGPMNRLVKTTVQQVAITAINASLYVLCEHRLRDRPISGACGHSVGEYSALYAAQAITLEDLFRAIDFRSRLMDELSQGHKGVMLAVKPVDSHTLATLIATSGLDVDICCDNSPRQQVVGGTASAMSEFARLAAERGYETVRLGVSGAWHTRLMAEGVSRMEHFLADVTIRKPRFPVLMNVTAVAGECPDNIRRNLALHLTHTVKWRASMERLLAAPTQFIEISNKPYLTGMLNDFHCFDQRQALHCRKA